MYGQNIVPVTLTLFSNVGERGSSPDQLRVSNIDSTQAGTILGHSSKVFSDANCMSSDTDGRLGFRFEHADSQTVDIPGTYTSTLTLIVRPQ